MDQNLPSDRLTTPTRRAPWIIGGVLAVGVAVSAIAFGPAVAAQLAPAPSPTQTVAPADTAPTLSPDELAAVQQSADEQQAIISADEKAAADAAAAAAAAAAAKSAPKANAGGGAIHCPAGSFANSNDGVNDTSCFPDICSHIQVPDPAHPECDAAFKP